MITFVSIIMYLMSLMAAAVFGLSAQEKDVTSGLTSAIAVIIFFSLAALLQIWVAWE